MPRREACADLNAVRVLVADGLSRLDGVDQHSVNAARNRLEELDRILVSAAGGLSGWTRTAMNVAMSFPIAWAVAAGSTALGFPPGWVITVTVLAFAGVQPVLDRARDAIAARVDRRRMNGGKRPFRVTVVVPGRLTEVPEPLLRARVQLVSAALRQVDSRRWRSPQLVHSVTSVPSLNRISLADLLLCQAIGHLETYLDEQRVGLAG